MGKKKIFTIQFLIVDFHPVDDVFPFIMIDSKMEEGRVDQLREHIRNILRFCFRVAKSKIEFVRTFCFVFLIVVRHIE